MADFLAVRINIKSQMDVIACRQQAREAAIAKGFGLADQTRLATAVSELARNALQHGGGGVCQIESCQKGLCDGVHVLIEDAGPGIGDIKQAMEDGFSTDRGLGMGLPSAKRLVHVMDVESEPGRTVFSIELHLKP